MNITVEVSTGEFLDKISILEIKSERIQDAAKLVNINKELEILKKTWVESPASQTNVSTLMAELKAINEALWDIEDRIRIKESQAAFDEEFIELSRSVYITNDRRSDVKRQLNQALGSNLMEEKSYADYQRK